MSTQLKPPFDAKSDEDETDMSDDSDDEDKKLYKKFLEKRR